MSSALAGVNYLKFRSPSTAFVLFSTAFQAELRVESFSKGIPPGFTFCDLHLLPGHEFSIYSQDPSICYPAFVGSVKRGATHVVGKVQPLESFAGTCAPQDFVARRKRLGLSTPSQVLAAKKGLVMGDISATAFALEPHTSLLIALAVCLFTVKC